MKLTRKQERALYDVIDAIRSTIAWEEKYEEYGEGATWRFIVYLTGDIIHEHFPQYEEYEVHDWIEKKIKDGCSARDIILEFKGGACERWHWYGLISEIKFLPDKLPDDIREVKAWLRNLKIGIKDALKEN